MPALFMLLLVALVSLLITKIGAVALMHTGLSREAARFQARSAFSGVGFTTSESEAVVRHPVRRRIIMMLMFLGNVGFVTAASALILTFIGAPTAQEWGPRVLILFVALVLFIIAARSRRLDRQLSRIIGLGLRRWTDLPARDYEGLLHLTGDYTVTELEVEEEDWLGGKNLRDAQLRAEGVEVLGITRREGHYVGVPTGDTRICPGDTLILYGQSKRIRQLDQRLADWRGEYEHRAAMSEAQREVQQQRREDQELLEHHDGERQSAPAPA